MEIHIFKHLDFLEGSIFVVVVVASQHLWGIKGPWFFHRKPGSILGQMEREKEEEGQVRMRLGDEGVDRSGNGLEPRGRTRTSPRHTSVNKGTITP